MEEKIGNEGKEISPRVYILYYGWIEESEAVKRRTKKNKREGGMYIDKNRGLEVLEEK